VTPVRESDIFTVGVLQHALIDAMSDGRSRFIVDLNQLTFMDANTLGVLVLAHRRATAAGGVCSSSAVLGMVYGCYPSPNWRRCSALLSETPIPYVDWQGARLMATPPG